MRAPYIWVLDPTDCTPGLRHQPDGPFAAVVFCEQSFGAYLAVAYLETMASPGQSHVGPWGVSDRVWQDSTWAGDATSFLWTPDGKSLITATSTNYGTGALYQLDLMGRTVKQLEPDDRRASPREPGPGYVLERIDLERGVLYYHALPWNLPAGFSPEDSLILTPAP
jgi:hypothetical protein